MTSPSEKYMEAARELMEGRIRSMCMTWDHSFGLMNENAAEGLRRAFRQISYHDIVPFIATALANAEREGMRRAADVVRAGREVSDPNDNYRSTIMVNWDDDDACADAILSEIGDQP